MLTTIVIRFGKLNLSLFNIMESPLVRILLSYTSNVILLFMSKATQPYIYFEPDALCHTFPFSLERVLPISNFHM